nr:MAG TPA: hypothetical protein [Caudoviricetes sp.]
MVAGLFNTLFRGCLLEEGPYRVRANHPFYGWL